MISGFFVLSPLDEKNEDIERLKRIQLDLHKDFIDVVEKSRGSKLNKSEIELFSGEFWSGSKAKNLGLIDNIGDANQILREKYGENVVIKKLEKSKSWLSKKLSSSNDHYCHHCHNYHYYHHDHHYHHCHHQHHLFFTWL